jgi:hypothetical protein
MSGALRRPLFSRALLSLKEAGVHLVELDESGNTGTNLNDKEQPIFLLAALIVPEAAWRPLERDLEQAITRHIPTMADGQEIHAVDLRSGRVAFAGSPVGARIAEPSGEWVGIVASGQWSVNLKGGSRALRPSVGRRGRSRARRPLPEPTAQRENYGGRC